MMYVPANQSVLRPASNVFFIHSPLSISWACDRDLFERLRLCAHGLDATWTGECWNFPSQESLEQFFAFGEDAAEFRTWRRISAYRKLAGEVIIVYVLPHQCGFAYTHSALIASHCYQDYWLPVTVSRKEGWWQSCPIVIEKTIYDFCEKLRALGADVTVIQVASVMPVRVEITGSSVHIVCSPDREPAHYLLRQNRKHPVDKPWDGTIVTTPTKWDIWRKFLEVRRIPWEGVNPASTP